MLHLCNIFKRHLPLLAFAVLLFSCSGHVEHTPDAEFAEWIKAYSGGVLKEGVPVKIVLSRDVESDALTEMSQEQLNALSLFLRNSKVKSVLPRKEYWNFSRNRNP